MVYHKDDSEDYPSDIRLHVESNAYLRYVEALEERGTLSTDKHIADLLSLLPHDARVCFQKDPDYLVWLLVSDDNTDYTLPKVDAAKLNKTMAEHFSHIRHSAIYGSICEIAHEIAALKTMRDMAFHAAFELSIKDSPTEESISRERAKITAYAQKHALICHEISAGNGDQQVNYHAVTELSRSVFDIALEACANVKVLENRELDQWLLDRHDESHITRQYLRTAEVREQLFSQLFLGSNTFLHSLYEGFIGDVARYSGSAAMVRKCPVDGETLLAVVNRQMRIEALRRNDDSHYYHEYWPAPKDQSVITNAQAKAFVGTGSVEGSFGERAQQLVELRAESEHVLDAVLAARDIKLLDTETLLKETEDRLKVIVPTGISDTQLHATAQIMLEEALDVVQTSRQQSNRR